MPRTPARDRPGPRDLEIVESHRRRTDAGSFHWKDVAKAFRRQRWSCYYCGLPFPYFRTRGKPGIRTSWFQIEHKTPISRGGTNDPANLCLACKTCNRLKGTKTEEEFLRGKPPGYLEKEEDLSRQMGRPVKINPAADPEFQSIVRQYLSQLDAKYGESLDAAKEEIKATFAKSAQ